MNSLTFVTHTKQRGAIKCKLLSFYEFIMFEPFIKRSGKYSYLAALMMFFLLGPLFFSYTLLNAQSPPGCLTIRNLLDHRILYKKPVKPGDTFVYAFTHSLEKLPVYETFRIAEDFNIILTETKLQSLTGSGQILFPGEKVIFEKDGILIKSERRFKSITLRISYFYKQQLIFSGERIELQQFSQEGESIELIIKEDCP